MKKLGQLKIAVEDKYILLQLAENDCLLPSNDTLYNISRVLKNSAKHYDIVCDIRDLKLFTNDVLDFINEIYTNKIILLTTEDEAALAKEYFKERKKYPKILPLKKMDTKFNYEKVHLPTFYEPNLVDDPWLESYKEDYKDTLQLNINSNGLTREEYSIIKAIRTEDEDEDFKTYEHFLEILNSECLGDLDVYSSSMEGIVWQKRYFEGFIKTIGRNSLLTEISFSLGETNEIQVVPYHTNSVNTIEEKNQIILGRPQVLAQKTNALLSSELQELSRLMQGNNVSEFKIHSFLDRHPNFLKSLGYKNIYSKIVLERDNGSKNLIPDFFLEPIGDEWCDILDIKLPDINIAITGNSNRYKFSEAVNSLQAQLREYAAFFENEKYAKRIEKKYGIKCYRPKLIGVIGNKIDATDERQLRRMMTGYSDLEVVTFNKLYEIARSRILL